MKCPTCPESTLLMSERQGVEIDYCPSCRGVWLDRGELDKLVALSGRQEAPPRGAAASPEVRRPDFEDSDSAGARAATTAVIASGVASWGSCSTSTRQSPLRGL